MRVITDVQEIARLSELNADRNYEFRTFLKCSSRWSSDRTLDALVHEILAEVNAAIDCTTCANCCGDMCINVSDGDIERLARRTGVTVKELEERHVAVDDDGEKFLPEEPCPSLGGRLCTVYDDRPAVCREFPHLHKSGFRQRLLSVIGSAGICPIVFNVYEELKRRIGWRPRYR